MVGVHSFYGYDVTSSWPLIVASSILAVGGVVVPLASMVVCIFAFPCRVNGGAFLSLLLLCSVDGPIGF